MEVPEPRKAMSALFEPASHCAWSTLAMEAGALSEAGAKGGACTPTTSVDSFAMMEDRGTECSELHARHVDLLQLNELNWSHLARDQEWRTTLHLRNLTWKLCDEGMLQAFLQRSGLMDSIEKIQVKPGSARRSGSALLYLKGVEEVAKVAKFFHGRQFPGARSPVAVSFADLRPPGYKVPATSLGDPQRVNCFRSKPQLGCENFLKLFEIVWLKFVEHLFDWTLTASSEVALPPGLFD
ncbi:unnamed protein product [Effrenium voratum]|nr:unnamed protein product [Effrenium voratum]CAJ1462366.1 unnamed protein product [Effrenium voratum]